MLRIYFKTAFRSFQKNKAFTAINVIGLAIGTLCCLYIILYIQDQYSYDKHHHNGQNIYRINTIWTVQNDKGNWATATAPVAPAMKHDFPEVEEIARIIPAVGMDHHLLRYKEKSVYANDAAYADSTLFRIFDFHFNYGNPKTALAFPNTVVLMKSVSDKLFGHENPIGKVIQIGNSFGLNHFTIGGVMDETLGKTHIHADFFFSMNSGGYGGYFSEHESWTGDNVVISYVKLRPHTNVVELENKFKTFVEKHAQTQLKREGMTKQFYLQPVSQIHTTTGFKGLQLSNPVSPVFLKILLVIAVLVQVIACINFMNLSTARASNRAKEVGIRKVIGASRADLVKQFLGESMLLSFVALLIAVPLLIVMLPYLNDITEADIKLDFLSDYRLWLMLFVILAATGLVAGSYPAFYLSAFKEIKVIKGALTSHLSSVGIRRSLVVFQFALSFVLITGIVVIYSQLHYIKTRDLGFDPNQKIGFTFHTNENVANIPAFVNNLRKVAGITSVSRTDNIPGQDVLYNLPLFVEGQNMATATDAKAIEADEHFMKTAGIELAAGRNFRPLDSGKVIINETLAKTLGLHIDQVQGAKVFTESPDGVRVSFEIVGVIRDYNFNSLREEITPLFIRYITSYIPEVLISTNSSNYKALLGQIAVIWHKHFAGVPLEYTFVDDEVREQYHTEITLSYIINSFTLVAIFISCLGLFGLTAFTAEQRTKEIGVRKVLGASVSNIVQLLSKDFLKLVIVAIVIGLPIAGWVMHEWLNNFSYRIDISWWMFVLAGLIALLVALITVSLQAVKAAMTNPVKSLKGD